MEQDELRYSTEHLWVRIEEDQRATIGLTEDAFQDGEEITKIRLLAEGDEIIKDETFGRLTTSRPAVIRLYAPVNGEILEVNEDILDAPEMILEDPYEEGWLLRVEITNMTEYDDLMTRDEYDDFVGEAEDELDEDDLDEEDLDEDDEDEEDEL